MPIAKIILKDEVNCKIEGLEPNVRRKLMQTFKFEKPGARYMPAVRLGRWDGCVNFFHLGGSTYINLLPEIIPIIEDYGYQFLLDDQRSAWPEMIFEPVTATENAHIKWPAGHRLEGQPIMLDEHQVMVCNAFLSNLHGISKASTGAGKCLAGNTVLTIGVSNDTEFGAYLLNKVSTGAGKDVTKTTQKNSNNLGGSSE